MRIILIRILTAFAVILFLKGPAAAQEPNEPQTGAPAYKIPLYPSPKLITIPPEKLFSPTASQLFYEMAYEISHRDQISESQVEQAIILLNAAMELDVSSGFAAADMLAILSQPGPARHLQLLYDSLIKYVKKDADCLIASNAARYLLEQLDTRQQREQLLARLIRDIGESNPAIRSDLATEIGLTFAERADDPNAARTLAIAYSWNRYNQLAYEKLIELVPEQISPVSNLEYLRFKIRANPLDIDSAITYAQYARKIGLYDISAGAYQYSADLFTFLFPGRPVPTVLYIEWITSLYNSPRNRPKCLQLAEDFRKQGRFDLQIEVIAARAAETTGDAATAANILKTAEQKALGSGSEGQADYKSLAWFYCFVLPDPDKALDYANKAYSSEPNSADTAGLLACAFADNNQPNLAKPLLDNYPQTQFASYAQAKIQLTAGNKQPAIDAFRTTIDKDPGSLVAEKAMLTLIQQGSDYIPIFDTNLITTSLKLSVGEQLVPQFVSPDRIIAFGLNVRGNRFSYGNDITGAISITNNGFEPLVISEYGLCKGRITIDAEVTGDLQARFENLVSITTRPGEPILPGRSHIVGVRLSTGKLRDLLLQHPQAELKIRFTACLDPLTNSEDETVSAIPGIKSAIIEIERSNVEVTTDFVQNRFNSLTKGKQGPRVKTAQLFAGLMMESSSAENPRQGQTDSSSYKPVASDWLNTMLKSALVTGLTDSDWVVKVHTMAAIEPLNLDYDLINACSQGLNEKNWPARMMAVKLLAEKQPDAFTKVLDHTAQYDDNTFVRDMAVAFGAKVSEPNQTPQQPFLKMLLGEPNAESSSDAPSAY
jgi:thioredoxin-like negative regulator of GroEL